MRKSTIIGKTRFDTRLPIQQKILLEKAANLGGYRSLTDFILLTAQAKAMEIISKYESIIASQSDSEIFFDALVNPKKPGKNLKSAANDFKNWVYDEKED
jgi:uncharacterized protein (DUF1778 family)